MKGETTRGERDQGRVVDTRVVLFSSTLSVHDCYVPSLMKNQSKTIIYSA